jgi:hypothetical protein
MDIPVTTNQTNISLALPTERDSATPSPESKPLHQPDVDGDTFNNTRFVSLKSNVGEDEFADYKANEFKRLKKLYRRSLMEWGGYNDFIIPRKLYDSNGIEWRGYDNMPQLKDIKK